MSKNGLTGKPINSRNRSATFCMTVKSFQTGLLAVLCTVILFDRPWPVKAQPPMVLKNFVWGRQVGQFQMATALDESNGLVHCWIHNATGHKISCLEFDFGYVEFVNLEVRIGTNWIALKPWIVPGGDATVDPLPYHQITITPYGLVTKRSLGDLGQTELMMKAYTAYRMYEARFQTLTNRIASRCELSARLCQTDTFAFDFVVHNPFATDTFTNLSHLRARVSQKFRSDPAGNTLVLYSPEFDIPVFKFRRSIFE